jgi:hypothetical protein
VHETHVAGRRRSSGDQIGEPPGRRYVTFSADALARPEAAASISGWIETAATYASAEKRFVDELIGFNAGVIDLEMGRAPLDERYNITSNPHEQGTGSVL